MREFLVTWKSWPPAWQQCCARNGSLRALHSPEAHPLSSKIEFLVPVTDENLWLAAQFFSFKYFYQMLCVILLCLLERAGQERSVLVMAVWVLEPESQSRACIC